MNIRTFLLQAFALAIAVLVLASCSNTTTKKQYKTQGNSTSTIEKKKWNILFVSIDDLNTWTGHLDTHPNAVTPNIDRLAKRGVSFRHAYSPAPHCKPARAAIMTGMRPWETGVYHGKQDWFSGVKQYESIPQFFARHGYHIMGTGKLFHNGDDGHTTPGYWHEYGDFGYKKVKSIREDRFNETLTWGPSVEQDEEFPDYKRVSWAIERLQQKHDKPFFLGVGIYKPHLAWHVPQKYFDLHPIENIVVPKTIPNDLDDVPAQGKKWAENIEDVFFNDHKKIVAAGKWKQGVQGYLATSSFADALFGRLLEALDNSPYKDNTIIILWGDHGWHLGEKNHWRKHALWEESTNTSFLIHVPGLENQNRIDDTPIDLMTIYPTLAELTGLPEPKHSGKSMVPLLENPDAPWDTPAIMTYMKGNHAVRFGPYRYIFYADGGEELYDHRSDPYEWINLAENKKYADVKARLKAFLPTKQADAITDYHYDIKGK